MTYLTLTGISVYLLLGAIFSLYAYKNLDKKIEEYEKGESSIEAEGLLDELKRVLEVVGGQNFLVLMFLVCTVFWLPLLFLEIKEYLTNK